MKLGYPDSDSAEMVNQQGGGKSYCPENEALGDKTHVEFDQQTHQSSSLLADVEHEMTKSLCETSTSPVDSRIDHDKDKIKEFDFGKKRRPRSPPQQENRIGTSGNTSFVSGSGCVATEWDLKSKFSRFGHVRDICIARNMRATPESYEVSNAPLGTANEVVLSGPAARQHSYNAWKSSPGTSHDWVVCGSALSSVEKNLLARFEKISGTTISRGWQPNVTHVIAAMNEEGACSRTFEVLMAILNGKWILKFDWIKACMEQMGPVPEEPYEVGLDSYGCCYGPKNDKLEIMDKEAPKLFNGLHFHFLEDFEPSYKENLEELVLAAGGTVLSLLTEALYLKDGSKRVIVYNNRDPMLKKAPRDDSSIVSLNHKETKAIDDQPGPLVLPHTWILESIAGCKLQFLSR